MDNLSAIATASSTPSGRGKQLFWTECVRLSLKGYKGTLKSNVSERRLQRSAVFAHPVPEFLKALNVSRTEVVRFTTCLHGLVNAQSRWHARVVRGLVDGRWTPMVLELCVVVLRDESGENARDLHVARGGFLHLRDDLVTTCASTSSRQFVDVSTSALTGQLERWSSAG